eukprot:2904949-Pyramimonas_sp.AAC.1
MQQTARAPHASVQPLAAMFGKLGFEQDPALLPSGPLNGPNVKPWALQFVEDLTALRISDDWADLLDE